MKHRPVVLLSVVLAIAGTPRNAPAYVEAPFTLGKIIADSSNVLVITVTSVDKQKNLIIYRKVRDIKGVHPGETIKHNIGQGGFHPREWQNIMAWAEVGKTAVLFHNGSAGEVCLDNYWYQVYAGDWWNLSHAEPYMLRSFAGKPEKLAVAVTAMLAGQEVVVPCMVDGDKNALQLRNARMQRLKASVKLLDYDAKRDFVDWGAGSDEFRAVAGMPGFTHLLALSRVSPGAGGIAVADFNGDGRPDFCLCGTGRASLFQNAGNTFDEIRLPLEGGARSAAWADFDGDGKPDLLLATPAGAKLLRFDGKTWQDVSGALPDQGYANVTAAAWIDYDLDGRPDVLVADGFRGLRLYRNRGAAPGPPPAPKIGNWYYAGPFDNAGGRGFDTVYPPERVVDTSQRYVGKNNEPVVWREGKFTDGKVNDLRLFKPELHSGCVVYVYREFDFGGAVEMPVGLGSDDTLTVWLNGVKIHAENVSRGCIPDQVQLKLNLRPGKNALLLKICNGDGDFAFAFSAKMPGAVTPRAFDDVSDAVKLGTGGVGGSLKGDHLAVADVNGDNRPDFLYSAGNGLLVLNTPHGFVEASQCGITYRAGGVAPAFGDFNGDGRPDVAVPQRGGCRLFRNEGNGRFADVTGPAGDLARPLGDARCAAWANFNQGGPPGLFVGCWKGPNRYFRNNGNGTFTEATEETGLMARVFNTGGVAVFDSNNDGVPDVVFNNEAQDPVVLLANGTSFRPPPPAKVAPAASPAGAIARPESPPAPVARGEQAIARATGVPTGTDSASQREAVGDRASNAIAALETRPIPESRPVPEAEAVALPADQTPRPAVPGGARASPARSWKLLSIVALLAAVAALAACAVAASRWRRAAPALLLLLVTGNSRVAADWPTARGNPQRTGNVDGVSGPKAPAVLWVYKSQEHFVAAPVPGTQALFVGGIGTDNTGVFHPVASAPQGPARPPGSQTAPFITRPTVCAPAVVEGLVITGDGMHQTDDAILYCLQAETGLPVWQLPVPGKLVHLEAGPTVDRGRVYVCGGDAGVLCVDLKRVTLDGREQDVPAVIPELAKRWAALTAKYEEERKKDPLLAIPPSEDALPKPIPKLLWNQGRGQWHIDAPPTVAGDLLLVASSFLDDEKVGWRGVLCLRVADGSVVWKTPLPINPWAGPTVADNMVIVGCSSIRFDRRLIGQAQGEVVALDLASGQVRWRDNAGGGVLSPVAAKGGLAVYTSTAGKVVACNAAGGQRVWAYDAGRPLFAGVAIAGDAVYAADLRGGAHALQLTDGRPLWKLDVAADPSVQSRSFVFGSPVVHGGDLYLATCNLDGEADQPSVIVCLSDKRAATAPSSAVITVDKQQRTVSIPCRIAPRKLPTLKDIYPLEVVATYPSPHGQKAHETVVTFECKPSEVHQALESLGLKPGQPVRGEGAVASGPELRVFLEVPGITRKPVRIPIEKVLMDSRTGKLMPPLEWHFTGSALRQPDPNKPDRVYGADLSGTLIALVPVTDEVVCQTNLTMAEERLIRLDTNKNVLPEEGTEVRLILQVK